MEIEIDRERLASILWKLYNKPYGDVAGWVNRIVDAIVMEGIMGGNDETNRIH